MSDQPRCTLLKVRYSDGTQLVLEDPPESLVTRALYKLAREWVQGAIRLEDLGSEDEGTNGQGTGGGWER